jgi:hypothetical protein
LHGFFHSSKPTIATEETQQDTIGQRRLGEGDIMLDLCQSNDSLQAHTVFHRPESLPLVPKLPNFKHTTLSLMLGELVEGSQIFESQKPTAKQSTEQMPWPANFFNLEYKLRKYIWILALQRSRIIELTNSTTYSTVSRAAVPALLHTCRESRAIAKEHYVLSFATQATSPKVYFDFNHDWLYTRCSGCLGVGCTHKLTLTSDHKKVKHLVFEGPMKFNPFPKILRFYPGIENLILIGSKSSAKRDEIDKTDLALVDKSFEWECGDGLLALAKIAWTDLDPTVEKPLPLTYIWRATISDIVDDVKRSTDPTNGLWTCCS